MHLIKLKKDGIYHQGQRVKSFLPFLDYVLEFDKSILFEDFFKHIIKEADKYSQVFSSHLGFFNLRDWEVEWYRPVDVKDEYMTHLEIEIGGEVDDGEFTPIKTFHGVGINKSGERQTYGISFCKINQLNKYPLVLCPKFEIFSWEDPNHKLVQATTFITVYDVIGTVLNEISFHGSPKKREKAANELRKRCDDIKDKIEKGEEVGIPYNEAFKQLRERVKDTK